MYDSMCGIQLQESGPKRLATFVTPKRKKKSEKKKQNGCTTISADFQLKSFADFASLRLMRGMDYYIRISHAHGFKHSSIEIFISKTKTEMAAHTDIEQSVRTLMYFLCLCFVFIAFKLCSLHSLSVLGRQPRPCHSVPTKYL